LLIGISLFLFSGCDEKVDNEVYCKYIYTNNSDYPIEIKVFNTEKEQIYNYNIPISDTILIELHGEGGAGPFQYSTDINQQGDSVVVIFNNQRYISFIKGEGVLYEKAYLKTQVSSIKVTMEYTFTNNNYDSASVIN